ncbi:hypothetical protein [Edaphobacter sp. 12200R-103]|jgi:hypothetical protein|uniref:hypothetical protein n=1 Tax=Edaphobacter sp. 12200R-103 TaxID=2703788 RepID=UPI00138C45FC|nr:hypothetical protein [Edaphobacter sp. 12200R-103]QHS51883.1 hypothetical protein GWR55_09135 [Edaphobacter sp. 12200R-103]
MADPIDPLRKHAPDERKEDKIESTRNDPTPQSRVGDSRFLPVVILAAIALIVLLIAGIVLVKRKGTKMVPHEQDNHPTSSIPQQPPAVQYG